MRSNDIKRWVVKFKSSINTIETNKTNNIYNTTNGEKQYPTVNAVTSYVQNVVKDINDNKKVEIIYKEVTDQFIVDHDKKCSFNLAKQLLSGSKPKLFINGIRIDNNAFICNNNILEYIPSENGNYYLTSGDRINIDYITSQ